MTISKLFLPFSITFLLTPLAWSFDVNFQHLKHCYSATTITSDHHKYSDVTSFEEDLKFEGRKYSIDTLTFRELTSDNKHVVHVIQDNNYQYVKVPRPYLIGDCNSDKKKMTINVNTKCVHTDGCPSVVLSLGHGQRQTQRAPSQITSGSRNLRQYDKAFCQPKLVSDKKGLSMLAKPDKPIDPEKVVNRALNHRIQFVLNHIDSFKNKDGAIDPLNANSTIKALKPGGSCFKVLSEVSPENYALFMSTACKLGDNESCSSGGNPGSGTAVSKD